MIVKLLIILTTSDNRKEYTNKNLKNIRSISNNLEINIVNPQKEEVDKFIHNAEIIISPKYGIFDFLDLSHAKRLKWIHITSTGIDSIIPLFKNKNILLTNSSGTCSIPIVEHVFSYLLMFAREFNKSYLNQKKKIWNTIVPNELYGKTIGIIGYGNVGKRITSIAKAFDMKIYASSYIKKNKSSYIVFEKNITKILSKSDYVINCLPLTDKTIGYFSYKKFEKMKNSACFINIGHGKTVNQKDLILALKNQIISHAGLDVFDSEPLSSDSKLWSMNNVILTPHNAGRSPEYTNRMVDIFCKNLRMYLSNKKLPNRVNLTEGY